MRVELLENADAAAEASQRRILLVDDREFARELVATELEEAGFEVVQATDGDRAWEQFCLYPFDLVITDLRMPKSDGMALLRRISSSQSPQLGVPVLMLSAFGTLSAAAEAGRAGAVDFLPFNDSDVEEIIERAKCILDECGPELPPALLGSGPHVRELLGRLEALAPLHTPMLISGPKGNGRQAVARYIHQRSPYAARPFIAITAEDAGRGMERLREGTCYLEDLHQFPQADQVRVRGSLLDTECLGASAPLRMLVSLPDDPMALSARGLLDPAIAIRLARFHVNLPPLCDRREDLPALIAELSSRIDRQLGKGPTRIPAVAIRELSNHTWHDNLQGLEAALETLIACSADGEVTHERVCAMLSDRDAPLSRIRLERSRSEKTALIELFRKHGTFSGVARELGITRNAAKYRLAKHNLVSTHQAVASPADRND